jgi:hypothetical protein
LQRAEQTFSQMMERTARHESIPVPA